MQPDQPDNRQILKQSFLDSLVPEPEKSRPKPLEDAKPTTTVKYLCLKTEFEKKLCTVTI